MTLKRAGIIQSNYIPWKGYLDFIASVDEFVLFDDVQYTRRDWRNRNRIKTRDGLAWLTIPVEVKGKYTQLIDETRIADPGWTREHASVLRHSYAQAPFFRQEWMWIEQTYAECAGVEYLSEVNERFLRAICARLGIRTPLRRSSEFDAAAGKNERLISICRELHANEYVSGPAAREYVDETVWNASGIEVRFKSYEGYREYGQLYPPFEHHVTVLDVLFHTGDDALSYCRSAKEFE